MSTITKSKPRARNASPKRAKSSAKTNTPPKKAPGARTKAAKPIGPRAGTKQALLIELLSRKCGATITELVEVSGWQPHSVRGAISGTLKKKLGLAVASDNVEGRGRVYRIPSSS